MVFFGVFWVLVFFVLFAVWFAQAVGGFLTFAGFCFFLGDMGGGVMAGCGGASVHQVSEWVFGSSSSGNNCYWAISQNASTHKLNAAIQTDSVSGSITRGGATRPSNLGT